MRQQHAGRGQLLLGKLAVILQKLQCLAMNAHLEESDDIRYRRLVRIKLEKNQNCQVRFDLIKRLVVAELTIATISGSAQHLEAYPKIEEIEKEPKVTVLQPEKTQTLINSVNKLVKFLKKS